MSIATWDGSRDERKKKPKKTKSDKDPNLLFKKRLAFFYPRVFLSEYFDILEILWSRFTVVFPYCFPSQHIFFSLLFFPAKHPNTSVLILFVGDERTMCTTTRKKTHIYPNTLTAMKQREKRESLHTWVKRHVAQRKKK